MGYTFKVGNAVPSFDKSDFPYLSAEWEVESATHTDAPAFPGDDMTGKGNSRSPSYTVWADFCRATNLTHVFFDDRGHLLASHPGCIGITAHDLQMVTASLEAYRATATLPPGFESDWLYEGPPNFDYHLARLIWLEWWMRWAVENCETPAIQNW